MAGEGKLTASMVLGIVGGVMGLPAAFCAGMCAAGLGGLSGESTAKAVELGDFYLTLGVVSSVVGLIFACRVKKNPKRSGIVMIIAGVLGGITIIAGNLVALVSAACFLVGGVLALTCKQPIEFQPSAVGYTGAPQSVAGDAPQQLTTHAPQGFNWMALFFAPAYYAGYGKFAKGAIFALFTGIPPVPLGIGIYAGIKANRELPVGRMAFNWGAASGAIAIMLLSGAFMAYVKQQFGRKGTAQQRDYT